MLSASKLKKVFVAGAAALTLGGAALTASTPAQAQWGYGYYGYGPSYKRYYRPNYGGAVAAGVVGGLALGALAASTARPAYYGTPAPAYYGGPVPAYDGCYVTRQSFIDPYGRSVTRKTRVCE